MAAGTRQATGLSRSTRPWFAKADSGGGEGVADVARYERRGETEESLKARRVLFPSRRIHLASLGPSLLTFAVLKLDVRVRDAALSLDKVQASGRNDARFGRVVANPMDPLRVRMDCVEGFQFGSGEEHDRHCFESPSGATFGRAFGLQAADDHEVRMSVCALRV
jgi:hypothetical protein